MDLGVIWLDLKSIDCDKPIMVGEGAIAVMKYVKVSIHTCNSSVSSDLIIRLSI